MDNFTKAYNEVRRLKPDNNRTKKAIEVCKKYNLGELTLQEIALLLGVSKERVRQIEEMALKKLRHPKNSKKIREFRSDVIDKAIKNE